MNKKTTLAKKVTPASSIEVVIETKAEDTAADRSSPES
jgi:hypothetical protein